jgi:hypothetical protein
VTQDLYRYQFRPEVPIGEVEETLLLAVIAAESLHGESQARLDIGHAFSAETRTCVIDATTEVGRDFNRLFIGFISREFGRSAFQVERVGARPEPTTV